MAGEDDSGSVPESITPSQNESKSESKDSSTKPALEEASGFRKETFYEDITVPPREILRKCLQDSFKNREDARSFCFDYCKEVYQNLSNETPFSQILTEIIQDYDIRVRERELWQWIRGRNESNYQQFPVINL